MSELAKAYLPADVERKWFLRWTEARCFHGDETSARPAYSIVIPPPNVTGVLHLGHVLNNTLQDLLARRARMQGKEVCWLPGMDHAGIATQTVVERNLRQQDKITRRDLGREEFVKRVWEWKEKHGGIIIDQLKRLGCSCDWDRERFTMDAAYVRRVQEVFVDLFRKGLLYRGRRMVNWCPKSLTALSDEEVIMKPQRGKLYTMRYELVEKPGTFLEIATTRPETLMGDTAVAVNPKDGRYAHLIGTSVWRPFPREAIPIVGDEHVDFEFGTGVLKVTPAHDKTDYEIGLRHNLPILDILNPDCTMNELAGSEFAGLDRFEARKRAAAKLEEMGQLVKVEDYENSVGFSERADVPVEPRLSLQWFLKYPQVVEAARVVRDGEIQIRPERWSKTYLHWLENIQDWCVSRQLWWGHRIPVWSKRIVLTAGNGTAELLPWGFDSYVKGNWGETAFVHFQRVSTGEIIANPGREFLTVTAASAGEYVVHMSTADTEFGKTFETHGFIQDEDVLDTWFSAWLWPFATMDDATKARFYPTSDLVTGPDIIFFWVARMIMAGLEYEKRIPFENVFFTSIIRDRQGRKMSKSLGNSPDPLDLIATFGADGLRFGLLRIAPTGTDVKFDEAQIEEGRNFANKLWNACRYRRMQSGAVGCPLIIDDLTVFAIDILAKLDALAENLDTAFADYEFNRFANLLYEFFWSNYCDLYLETIKGDTSAGTLATEDEVLRRFLLLLHPLMPHVTEELWETLGFDGGERFLMKTQIPSKPVLAAVDRARIAEAQREAAAVYAAAAQARHLKAEHNVAASKDVRFVLRPATADAAAHVAALRLLAGAAEVVIGVDYAAPPGTPAAVTDLGELYLPLEGLVDVAAERLRLSRDVAKVDAEIERARAKLASPTFAERAPADVVAKARQTLADWEERRGKLGQMLQNLG